MNKRFSAIALVLALVVSIIVPFQAATPVSTVQWYGASDMAAADRDMVWYDNTTRTNASGNKITSNAHSADFGKMYFKWADKQSDDCYLKVEASVFETVEYFVLTAKSTNKYYDVKIQPADGAELTEDDCYVFYLPRMVEKNKKGVDEYYVINMVFLDKVQYKKNPSVAVIKNWLDADGEPIVGTFPKVTFTNGYELGDNIVEIGTYVAFAEDEIEGYELVGITVDGDPVDAVNFKAVGNGRYDIVFTNQAVTIDVPAKGTLSLMKLLQQGEETVAWNVEHPYFDDNDDIYFDLYTINEDGTEGIRIDIAQADVAGLISFKEDLVAGEWYLIKERIDLPEDHVRYGKYIEIEPIRVQAWAEGEAGVINFTQVEDPDPDTGIVTKRDFIISNGLDGELKMYECLDSYENYLTGFNMPFFNLSDDVWACGTNIVPYWKEQMKNYSQYNNLFEELTRVWFTTEDNTTIKPEFVWNIDEFNDAYAALNGNTLIFEKTFTPYEELADDEIPLYVTADNAFFVFVNDKFVGASTSVKNPEKLVLDETLLLNEENLEALIGERLESHIDAAGDISTWAKTYDFDIKDFILPGEENKITIIAVNEAGDVDVNDEATLFRNDPTSNPGGIIFGCEIVSQTEKFRFVNELPEVVPSGMLVLSKFVEVNGDEIAWTESDYAEDTDLITFELYDPDALVEDPDCGPIATTQIDELGFVRFEKSEDIEPGKEYLVRETFDELIADKYVAQEWTFTAIEDEEDEDIDWEQYEIVNKLPQRYVLVSNPDDLELRITSARYGETNIYNVNGAQTNWGEVETFYAAHGFSTNDTNFASAKDIWLGDLGAEFVWNTADFSDVGLALSGDVVYFEKTFENVGQIVEEEVNLYVGGDNAFLVFVNGAFVGQSDSLVSSDSDVIGDLSDEYINCQDFKKMYSFNIKPFLMEDSDNVVTIVAINEAADPDSDNGFTLWPGASSKETSEWIECPEKNPAAFIFACEFSAK